MQDLVSVCNFNNQSKLATTSLKIAGFTGKRHDNILRTIETLVNTGKFTALNFEASKYTDSTGKELTMYILDRKFTSMILMRMTGTKALDWQEKFYDEFERMEKEIETLKKEPTHEQVRLQGKQVRRGLTDMWKAHGVEDGREYGALTNTIYRKILGTDAKGIRQEKGLTSKQAVRDNLSKYELNNVLIAETSVIELTEVKNPYGFIDNLNVTKAASDIAKEMILLKNKRFAELT